jgi:hypothetical protein
VCVWGVVWGKRFPLKHRIRAARQHTRNKGHYRTENCTKQEAPPEATV